jgi:glutamate formiminotransferase
MKQIVECIPNFSEGKDKIIIQKIADSAKEFDVKLLDTEWNESHNRSLMTIVGSPEEVFKASFAMIKTATQLIDMTKHKGEHPRIGATDVVPFVPVSGVSIEECVQLSKKLGQKVATELNIPVYLYEESAQREDRKNLADVRRGEYEGLKEEIKTNPDKKPDYGPKEFHPTAGAVVIGARKYLIAFNVNLDTKDIEIGKKIAGIVREKDGGLPGVKALGFDVDGYAQVSMNLVDYHKTNIDKAFEEVKKGAEKLGVKVKNSEIYGMIPLEALTMAVGNTIKADGFKMDQVLEKKLYE